MMDLIKNLVSIGLLVIVASVFGTCLLCGKAAHEVGEELEREDIKESEIRVERKAEQERVRAAQWYCGRAEGNPTVELQAPWASYSCQTRADVEDWKICLQGSKYAPAGHACPGAQRCCPEVSR